MNKILTGSQKSFLNNQQPKTPLGNSDNAIITTDGKNLLIKNLQTVAELGDDFETLAINKKTRRIVKSPGSSGSALTFNAPLAESNGEVSFALDALVYRGTVTIPKVSTDGRLFGAWPAALSFANAIPGSFWQINLGVGGPRHGRFTLGATDVPNDLTTVSIVEKDYLIYTQDLKWRLVSSSNRIDYVRDTVVVDMVDLTITPAGIEIDFSIDSPWTSRINNDTRLVNGPAFEMSLLAILWTTNNGGSSNFEPAYQVAVNTSGTTNGNLIIKSLTGADIVVGTDVPRYLVCKFIQLT